jgi:hypothetical protein
MSHQLHGGGRHCLAPGKDVGGDCEDETQALQGHGKDTATVARTLAAVKDAATISSLLQLQDHTTVFY